MPIQTLSAVEALNAIDRFDAVIDARSEAEHALDHLPHAVNWPTLNDAERAEIGTLYKQVNPFEARKRGAALAARNIARHIEERVLPLPKGWRPLVYCWRGGQRSGALSTLLGAIGFSVTLLEGGYRAWRAAVVADLPHRVEGLRWQVLCGPTGSGKTRLLQALRAEGVQVLDLEALACHRSSVLGHVPGQPQPGQKRFEGLLWQALKAFDRTRPVFVENESKKIGNLRVPDALMDAIRAADCVDLRMPTEERVALLMEDYPHFAAQQEVFCSRLTTLTALKGKAVVEQWLADVRSGQTERVVRDLLSTHYDPLYAASMARNYRRYEQAAVWPLADRSVASLQRVAAALAQQAARD